MGPCTWRGLVYYFEIIIWLSQPLRIFFVRIFECNVTRRSPTDQQLQGPIVQSVWSISAILDSGAVRIKNQLKQAYRKGQLAGVVNNNIIIGIRVGVENRQYRLKSCFPYMSAIALYMHLVSEPYCVSKNKIRSEPLRMPENIFFGTFSNPRHLLQLYLDQVP